MHALLSRSRPSRLPISCGGQCRSRDAAQRCRDFKKKVADWFLIDTLPRARPSIPGVGCLRRQTAADVVVKPRQQWPVYLPRPPLCFLLASVRSSVALGFSLLRGCSPPLCSLYVCVCMCPSHSPSQRHVTHSRARAWRGVCTRVPYTTRAGAKPSV